MKFSNKVLKFTIKSILIYVFLTKKHSSHKLNISLQQKNCMPNLYIISGCNGAGKTTASYTILPEMLQCKEFVNADEIAKG